MKLCEVASCLIFFCILQVSRLHKTVIFCIRNNENQTCMLSAEVQAQEVQNLTQLSADLLVSELDIQVYLSEGIHSLNETLTFATKNQSLNIQGSKSSNTTILCNGNAGMNFTGVRSTITLSYIIFRNCNVTKKVLRESINAGLIFSKTYYTLYKVSVYDSKESGHLAINCYEQKIDECKYTNNVQHIHVIFLNASPKYNYSIDISNSLFSNGNASKGGTVHMHVQLKKVIRVSTTLTNCIFTTNTAPVNGSHFFLKTALKIPGIIWSIDIINTSFSEGKCARGIVIWSRLKKIKKINILFRNCSFNKNQNGIIELHDVNAKLLNCSFSDNFLNSERKQTTAVHIYNYKNKGGLHTMNGCKFERNKGMPGRCSSVHLENAHHFTLRNSNFTNNECTGILLESSHMIIQNKNNLIGNIDIEGGALRLDKKSKLKFNLKSQLILTRNTARSYGGGIFSQQSCEIGQKIDCFFEFNSSADKILNFKENKARIGGDAIFGGCLSNCSLPSGDIVNVKDNDNIFWQIVAVSQSSRSQSLFAEFPNKVVFCSNHSGNFTHHLKISCNSSHEVTVYRGEKFKVPLMVTDDFCFPCFGLIRADIELANVQLEGKDFRLTNKSCDYYTFSLKSKENVTSASIKLFYQKDYDIIMTSPALLTVNFKSCPLGFRLKDELCVCYKKTSLRGIKCEEENYKLFIPPQTWLGKFEGKIAVQEYCQYCRRDLTVYNSSDDLCDSRRTGVLCGKCANGSSLKLGGYNCNYCPHKKYKGVILILTFGMMGIILIFFLLHLNLTVSSGLINGLIFYSNIVYTNSDIFMPIAEGYSTHLQNAVRFLFTFQAWLNLDFGISSCFFDGFEAYHMTWMQFIFPVYIWALILIIVFASRHSTKVSQWTKSNIVSVLATLLLLSYTKMMITTIGVVSYTRLYFLDGGLSYPVWFLDANIRYCSGKHVPLLILSTVMIIGYIIPFTLLVSFGYLIQARSECRILRWINKITPFLDAFYAPYTKNYRSWPGILLFVRLVMFNIFAIYSYGDGTYKLAFIITSLLFVLTISMVNNRIYKQSFIHIKRNVDYLEIFFLTNLTIFTALASYFQSTQDKDIVKKQILCLIMIGSVFVVAFGIVCYQLANATRNWSVIKRITQLIVPPKELTARRKKAAETVSEITGSGVTSSTTTHTTVQLQEIQQTSLDQLREPLLTT